MSREHGYAKYKLENCRCYTCSFAVSEYNRRRNEAIAAGTWRTETRPVQLHVRSLMVAGMGYKRVAALAGVAESTVGRLLYGRPDRGTPPPKTIRYDLAQAILAVELGLAPGSNIEASGTARRVQALHALGYTLTEQAERIGWTLQNFSRIIRDGAVPYAGMVTVRTAQDVGRMFDELSMIRPTGQAADNARKQAQARGWFPPLAWDDDTIDDPAALPCVLPAAGERLPGADELLLQHAAAEHDVILDMPTRVELIRRLTADQRSTPEIARIAQTTVNMVGFLRSKHRIGPLNTVAVA